MKILYVYAHPQQNSFNHFLKQHGLAYLNNANHQVAISDLYAQKFNPVASWHDFTGGAALEETQYFAAQYDAYREHKLTADIVAEINKIQNADHLIFQFPVWWFSMPAILKGWFDRVFVKGFAYEPGKIFADGLLKGKTASFVLSTQSPDFAYQVTGIYQVSLQDFLLPISHTLRFIGLTMLAPFVVYGAYDLEEAEKQLIIKQYESYLADLPDERNRQMKKIREK